MHKGRQGQKPDIVVCHLTDGNFPGSVDWVTNPFSEVSYHYMVSRAGEVTQCVDIEDTAWANGTDNSGGSRDNRHSRLEAVRSRRLNANLYTVSIGFEGRSSVTQGALTPEQLMAGAAVIRLIKGEIYDIWGKTLPITTYSIVGHSCIKPQHRPNCPGSMFPFEELIQILQKQQTEEACFYEVPISDSGPLPGHDPAEWALDGWLWAMDKLNMDGTRPTDNITRQEAVTLMHRLAGLLTGPVPACTNAACSAASSVPVCPDAAHPVIGGQ